MTFSSTATEYAATHASSAHVEPSMAAEEIVAALAASPHPADLLFLFASGRHTTGDRVREIASAIRESVGPGVMIGASGESVIAGPREIERAGAVSVLALSLPGVRLTPFMASDLHLRTDLDEVEAAREAIGASEDLRAVFFFADPFSVPATGLVPLLSRATAIDGTPKPIIGGLASAATAPGGNVLVLDDTTYRAGGVGVAVSGKIRIDPLVSQGCRPIGEPLVITAGERNVIRTLSGKPALRALHDTIQTAGRRERELLESGLLIGRVVNEYKDRFGRGDFLIRGVMGIDPEAGVLAIGESIRVGQTVQFHVRDKETATEDLDLLLDVEQLRSEAFGALLVTCNGRGSRLFDEPDADASRLVNRLSAGRSGDPVPVAGLFAAGEFGPIGGPSFVHGHTASAAIFRDPSA